MPNRNKNRRIRPGRPGHSGRGCGAISLLLIFLAGCVGAHSGNPITGSGDFAQPNSTSSVAISTSVSTGKENKVRLVYDSHPNLTPPM